MDIQALKENQHLASFDGAGPFAKDVTCVCVYIRMFERMPDD